jgi:hypothetical protein
MQRSMNRLMIEIIDLINYSTSSIITVAEEKYFFTNYNKNIHSVRTIGRKIIKLTVPRKTNIL